MTPETVSKLYALAADVKCERDGSFKLGYRGPSVYQLSIHLEELIRLIIADVEGDE